MEVVVADLDDSGQRCHRTHSCQVDVSHPTTVVAKGVNKGQRVKRLEQGAQGCKAKQCQSTKDIESPGDEVKHGAIDGVVDATTF